jgi:hypothetical protein
MFIGDDTFSSVPSGLIKALAAETLWRKVKILLPAIFLPEEVMSHRHPGSSLSYKIYYSVLRPFRLCLKYGKSALSMYRMKVNK